MGMEWIEPSYSKIFWIMVQWIPDNGSILYLFNGVLVILFYSSFQYLKQSWQYSRFTHYLSLNLRKSASNQGLVHVFSWIAQCFSPPGIFHRQKIHLNGVSFIHLLMSQGHGKTGWSWFLSAVCPFSVAELGRQDTGACEGGRMIFPLMGQSFIFPLMVQFYDGTKWN